MVIGSLGELVKKSIETDIRALDSTDKGALIECLALRKVLEQWPVVDFNRYYMLHRTMRHCIEKYRALEQEIISELDKKDRTVMELQWLKARTKEMFISRDEIRKLMAELTKISGGVGKASEIPTEAQLVFAKIGE